MHHQPLADDTYCYLYFYYTSITIFPTFAPSAVISKNTLGRSAILAMLLADRNSKLLASENEDEDKIERLRV